MLANGPNKHESQTPLASDTANQTQLAALVAQAPPPIVMVARNDEVVSRLQAHMQALMKLSGESIPYQSNASVAPSIRAKTPGGEAVSGRTDGPAEGVEESTPRTEDAPWETSPILSFRGQ